MKATLCIATAVSLLLAAAGAGAERMQPMGDYEAHYSLVPTTMLGANLATDYGVTRGPDRALLTVSILGPEGKPVPVQVAGTVRDLLGSERPLALAEVVEGDAVYYLAEIRHGDEEVLRFAIDVVTPDGNSHTLEFQQKLYWEDA